MNPKGIKPTITSHFKKPIQEIDFVSHEMMLMRTNKPQEKNEVSFRTTTFLSKPEIKQYLMKIYNLPVQNVNTFRRAGKIMKSYETN